VAHDAAASPTRGLTCSMCRCPTWARHDGQGDINLASSWR